METLRELCVREAPVPWQRALQIVRAIAMHRLPDRPALVSEGILVDGDQVHLTSLPEPQASSDSGDGHGWLQHNAFRLWRNLEGRAIMVRDSIFTYMSPEQLMGKPLSEASHIYSIGVISYELLTNRLPFPDAKGPAGLITAQLKSHPQPPSTHATVPPAVDALVLRCLHKASAERVGTLDALVRAIDELSGPPSAVDTRH